MEVNFDPSVTLPWIIGIVALILGWVMGRIDRRNAREKENKKPPEVVERIVEKVIPDTSLLSITLDEQMRPVVKLDGEPVSALGPEQRQRMIGLINILRPLLDVRAAPVQIQPKPGPITQLLTPDPDSAPTPSGVAPLPPQAGAGPISQRMAPPLTPAPEVKPVPVKISFGGAPKKQSQELARPSTIAAQIDEILQGKLVGHPLAQQGIKVMDSATGGVTIVVGNQRFEGVGDVPYPEVKAVLQQAIAEWEKKYTPGL
jgi:hypothetical protein